MQLPLPGAQLLCGCRLYRIAVCVRRLALPQKHVQIPQSGSCQLAASQQQYRRGRGYQAHGLQWSSSSQPRSNRARTPPPPPSSAPQPTAVRSLLTCCRVPPHAQPTNQQFPARICIDTAPPTQQQVPGATPACLCVKSHDSYANDRAPPFFFGYYPVTFLRVIRRPSFAPLLPSRGGCILADSPGTASTPARDNVDKKKKQGSGDTIRMACMVRGDLCVRPG